MRIGRLLPRSFFERDVDLVARELLGQLLVRDQIVLRITEVEAYGGAEDSASHSRSGLTDRNRPMWGPPGRAYVYLCYGLHNMLNVVADRSGVGSAVLIRSCEPLQGLDEVQRRRGGKSGPVLLTGPGKVAQALSLDVSWCDHVLYRSGGLELRASERVERVAVGARIGIDYAVPRDRAALRRFAIAGSSWVGHRKLLRVE